jgi:hypothetical protein
MWGIEPVGGGDRRREVLGVPAFIPIPAFIASRLLLQRSNRRDRRGPDRRNHGGQQRRETQHGQRPGVGAGIPRADPKQQPAQQLPRRECSEQTE